MILTVTLNVALDVTYQVDRLSSGDAVQVNEVLTRAGGKGLNVAGILASLGADVLATGLVGGLRGSLVRRRLAEEAIPEELFEIAAESRQTLTVIAKDGSHAAYGEPGPSVSRDEWEGFRARFGRLLDGCAQVVLAGSVPPGLPKTAYAELISVAQTRAVPVLLDSRGRWLEEGLGAAPAAVKVNRSELSEWARRPLSQLEDVLGATRAMLEASGAGVVIATLGPVGSFLMSHDGALRARAPEQRGNPVGAGDAFTAGWVAAHDQTLVDRLRYATAVGAASVRSSTAGAVDIAAIDEIGPAVEIGSP